MPGLLFIEATHLLVVFLFQFSAFNCLRHRHSWRRRCHGRLFLSPPPPQPPPSTGFYSKATTTTTTSSAATQNHIHITVNLFSSSQPKEANQVGWTFYFSLSSSRAPLVRLSRGFSSPHHRRRHRRRRPRRHQRQQNRNITTTADIIKTLTIRQQ